MTITVICIITSLNWLKKFPTVSPLSPRPARITPTNRANRMMDSMSPLARAWRGLVGMIARRVSARLARSPMATSAVSMEVMSSPLPGSITLAVRMAAVMARAVVTR